MPIVNPDRMRTSSNQKDVPIRREVLYKETPRSYLRGNTSRKSRARENKRRSKAEKSVRKQLRAVGKVAHNVQRT